MASGNTAEPHGLNAEGLRRRGFSAERIQALRRAYKLLYKQGLSFEEAQRQLAGMAEEPGEDAHARADLRRLLEFLARVTRGIVR